MLKKARKGGMRISDADDTIFSATNWHKKEYEELENSPELHARNIFITAEQAREIYELSKITIRGKAEKEPRYTPRLNIALLSLYTKSMEQEGKTSEQAFAAVKSEITKIGNLPDDQKENAVMSYEIDKKDILRIFNSNPLSNHLYEDYLDDFIGGTSPEDIRVVATRGTIEGPLGQVHKVHQTKIMDRITEVQKDDGTSEVSQNRIDMVIYTNDLKAEAMTLVPQLFPYLIERSVWIYDDNQEELQDYYKYALKNLVKKLEIFRVRHFGAKRAPKKFSMPKIITRATGSEIYDVPAEDQENMPDTEETVYDQYQPEEGWTESDV